MAGAQKSTPVRARSLADKRVVVIGGSAGMSYATARAALGSGARVAASIPARRVGTADEVAQTASYLMQGGFTTGTVTDIDGGHLAG